MFAHVSLTQREELPGQVGETGLRSPEAGSLLYQEPANLGLNFLICHMEYVSSATDSHKSVL